MMVTWNIRLTLEDQMLCMKGLSTKLQELLPFCEGLKFLILFCSQFVKLSHMKTSLSSNTPGALSPGHSHRAAPINFGSGLRSTHVLQLCMPAEKAFCLFERRFLVWPVDRCSPNEPLFNGNYTIHSAIIWPQLKSLKSSSAMTLDIHLRIMSKRIQLVPHGQCGLRLKQLYNLGLAFYVA